MQFDLDNKVMQLCAQGMGMEAEGNIREANEMFQQAWDIASNDFEAFTAAQYMARNQADAQNNLKWNLTALYKALAIEQEEMKAHYPSLYLNVAKSYENLNEISEAKRNYKLAAEYSNFLPRGPYGNMIKLRIGAGIKRTHAANYHNIILDGLINNWCERKELRPLSFILPAYLGNLGSEHDIGKLMSALGYLSAMRCLPTEEQEKIDGLVIELSTK